jgi:galactokinase
LNIIPEDLNNVIPDNFTLKLKDVKIIISNTHIPHKVDASQFSQRISDSKLAFEYLNKIRPLHNWDELTEDEFESMVSTISNPIAIKSAYHMISEVHRTKKAAQALKEADIFSFGQLMNASHNSLRDNLEIVSPEVDAMVTEAWKIEGVIGSRMTGCGFGGCTISLVKDEAIDLFVKRVGDIYEDITGIKNHFYIAEIGDRTSNSIN